MGLFTAQYIVDRKSLGIGAYYGGEKVCMYMREGTFEATATNILCASTNAAMQICYMIAGPAVWWRSLR